MRECLIFLLLSFYAFVAPSHAKLFNHESFTLKNGLQVYVIKNALAPVVNVSLIYKVGTADDPRDQHGLSHFLEHMMFKGTKSVPKGELDRLILQQGGIYNAHTTSDYTCYTTDIVKDQLELIFFIEADRMQNLSFSKSDVDSERQVVLEERAMRLDNHPFGKSQEIYLRSLFWKHPYGIPPIGYPEHIHAYTYESTLNHYKTYYAPNNAILIITGDVSLEDVKKLVTKYFEKIPSREVPERSRQEEPSHEGTTLYIDHKAPRGKLVAVHMSYGAPHYKSSDNKYVLPGAVLAQILGGNELSRLHRTFVEEHHMAASISANYEFESIDPKAFNISFTLNENVDPDVATEKVLDEIRRLLEKGISDHELSQAKRDMLAHLAFLKDGLSQSVAMFSNVAYGIPTKDLETWDEKINAVTLEQVMDTAKFLLNQPPSVILTLYPDTYKKPLVKDVKTQDSDTQTKSEKGASQGTYSANDKLTERPFTAGTSTISDFFKQLWEGLMKYALTVVTYVKGLFA